jgi:hypothetical protein
VIYPADFPLTLHPVERWTGFGGTPTSTEVEVKPSGSTKKNLLFSIDFNEITLESASF